LKIHLLDLREEESVERRAIPRNAGCREKCVDRAEHGCPERQ
jgi:hypothetical protein